MSKKDIQIFGNMLSCIFSSRKGDLFVDWSVHVPFAVMMARLYLDPIERLDRKLELSDHQKTLALLLSLTYLMGAPARWGVKEDVGLQITEDSLPNSVGAREWVSALDENASSAEVVTELLMEREKYPDLMFVVTYYHNMLKNLAYKL